MRAVLDTNVIISAVLSPAGPPGQILDFIQRHPTLVVPILSVTLVEEYRRALLYDHITVRHRLSADRVERFLGRVGQLAVMVEPIVTPIVVRDDPSDNDVLACGPAGGADDIVSGDRHLLRLGEYEGIPIVPPAVFLQILREMYGEI